MPPRAVNPKRAFLAVSQGKLVIRPSLESLRIFETCVASGSFVRAAERLSLTPAAVSLRIRTLEAELGQPLFARFGRRVVPTPAATALADRVRRAMEDIVVALDEFQRATPPIRVTAPPTFASRWLAPRLPSFRAPGGVGVELDVSSDVRDPDAFDVAIRTGHGGWAGLEQHPLLPVDVTPMLAPRLLGPRGLARPCELAEFDLLPHPDWERWFAEVGAEMPPKRQFVAVDYSIFELAANAAVSGMGVALLSPTLFGPLLSQGLLVAPFASVLSGPEWYFALLRKDDQRAAPRSFCHWLCEQARQGN